MKDVLVHVSALVQVPDDWEQMPTRIPVDGPPASFKRPDGSKVKFWLVMELESADGQEHEDISPLDVGAEIVDYANWTAEEAP